MKFNFKGSYSNPFFSIEEGYEESSDYKNNISEPYYRLTTDNSVICCVMDKLAKFVMVEKFCPNFDCFTLELPAGSIKNSETPMEAAMREFDEETGIKCNFIPLGEFHLMVNRVNSKEHIFFEFKPEIQSGKSHENGIEVKKILRSDLVKLSINRGYKQIAGLGVIQMASAFLGLDILTSDMEDISKQLFSKFN